MDFVYGYWYILWMGLGYTLGVVLHEFGHKIFCNLVGVKVHTIRYLNDDPYPNTPDGFIIHDPPENFFQSLMITLGPMFTVGIPLFLTWYYSFVLESDSGFILQYIGSGLFFAVFPSTWDVQSAIDYTVTIKGFWLVVIYPFLFILWIVSFYWTKIIMMILFAIILETFGVVTFFGL